MLATLNLETQLAQAGVDFIIGIDEVGRGAIAGPVAVGVFLLEVSKLRDDSQSRSVPVAGLKDSKLLSADHREALVEPIRDWALGSAIGFASAREIDDFGIIWSLNAAANKAWLELLDKFGENLAGFSVTAILDGTHGWFEPSELPSGFNLEILVQPKADRDCATVAAASVLAKVHRDSLMVSLASEHEQYGWESNKGYAAADHIRAVQRFGPSGEHRHSWLGKILQPELFTEA